VEEVFFRPLARVSFRRHTEMKPVAAASFLFYFAFHAFERFQAFITLSLISFLAGFQLAGSWRVFALASFRHCRH